MWRNRLKSFFIQLIILIVILATLYIIVDRVLFPVYTRHGEEFSLPDLNEQSIADAETILTEFGAEIVIKDSSYSTLIPAGMILSQIPKAHSTVKYGRRVYVTVSAGDRPRIVPNLLGLSEKQANFKLLPLGIKIRYVFRAYSSQYPNNTIMFQTIKEGENVDADAEIDVTISLGDNVQEFDMPNYIGLHISIVEGEAKKLGLIVEIIQGEARENLTPGTVIAQSIEAGNKTSPNKNLILTVSQ